MSIAPETAVSPVAQAPPDRPTTNLEDLLRQVIAIIFSDQKLDEMEQESLRGFMEEVAMRAQAAGGIGQGGGTPSADATQQAAPMSPMEQNVTGAQDFGDGQGEPTGQEY